MDEAEDCRVRSNSEGQRDGRNGHKPWGAPKRADSEANIVNESVHDSM
jgi:hypothetical protein